MLKYSAEYALKNFREIFKVAQKVVVITGSGISDEDIPVKNDAIKNISPKIWSKYSDEEDLSSVLAFYRNPSLVWEYYHYLREKALSTKPNQVYLALAECEKKFQDQDKEFTVITQNTDELHRRAGSQNVIEFHGSIFKTICLKCENVQSNYDHPISEGLRNMGDPRPRLVKNPKIPIDQLPKCKVDDCGGILRPDVTWFGEFIKENDLINTEIALRSKCDLCLVVGISSRLYPLAAFGPMLLKNDIPVAEFYIEDTSSINYFSSFNIQGSPSLTIPMALAE